MAVAFTSLAILAQAAGAHAAASSGDRSSTGKAAPTSHEPLEPESSGASSAAGTLINGPPVAGEPEPAQATDDPPLPVDQADRDQASASISQAALPLATANEQTRDTAPTTQVTDANSAPTAAVAPPVPQESDAPGAPVDPAASQVASGSQPTAASGDAMTGNPSSTVSAPGATVTSPLSTAILTNLIAAAVMQAPGSPTKLGGVQAQSPVHLTGQDFRHVPRAPGQGAERPGLAGPPQQTPLRPLVIHLRKLTTHPKPRAAKHPASRPGTRQRGTFQGGANESAGASGGSSAVPAVFGLLTGLLLLLAPRFSWLRTTAPALRSVTLVSSIDRPD